MSVALGGAAIGTTLYLTYLVAFMVICDARIALLQVRVTQQLLFWCAAVIDCYCCCRICLQLKCLLDALTYIQ